MKTIEFPDSVPLAEIVTKCAELGLRLSWSGKGVYHASPMTETKLPTAGELKDRLRRARVVSEWDLGDLG